MIDIGKKLWGYCHTLRHEGISHTRYIEQVTCLLFIKMADERGIDLRGKQFVFNDAGKKKTRTVHCDWSSLMGVSGADLLEYYKDVLETLAQQKGILGDIFVGTDSRFKTAKSLEKLLVLIDEIEWTSLGVDVKARAYESLLEQAASESKKGAGQFFTPRILIQTIVRCIKPDPRARKGFTICDPACGTGGFLVCAYEWFVNQMKKQAVSKAIKNGTYFGQDIDDEPRRLALMNFYLHNVEPNIKLGDAIYESPDQTNFYDVVLANPPFGTRGASQYPKRSDFAIPTSNKQLNFIQHIMSILRDGGRAAIVLPDNCLFADQAGIVFEVLTRTCDLHTVLRLPDGTFTPYSPGTKTNVIFFTKGKPTQHTWVYDARTNVPHITKKDRPLSKNHFVEFERCFGDNPFGRSKRTASQSRLGTGYLGGKRWKQFDIKEIQDYSYKIDSLRWLPEEWSDGVPELPEPEELATAAISELNAAVSELNQIVAMLENGNSVEVNT